MNFRELNKLHLNELEEAIIMSDTDDLLMDTLEHYSEIWDVDFDELLLFSMLRNIED